MMDPITVTSQSRSYTWDGERWYGTNDFKSPPQAIVAELDALIADRVGAADQSVTDFDHLLDLAKRSHAAEQLPRARSLAERAAKMRPDHVGAATVLCSILRSMGRSEEAVSIAKRFRTSSYTPILTSRAAALCDLRQYEEALHQIRQVLAIENRRGGAGREALAVHARIKAEAPELFDP